MRYILATLSRNDSPSWKIVSVMISITSTLSCHGMPSALGLGMNDTTHKGDTDMKMYMVQALQAGHWVSVAVFSTKADAVRYAGYAIPECVTRVKLCLR